MLGAVPADVATVVVDGPHGRYRYLALSAAELRWLCEHAGAVEFHGWGCTAENPEGLRSRASCSNTTHRPLAMECAGHLGSATHRRMPKRSVRSATERFFCERSYVSLGCKPFRCCREPMELRSGFRFRTDRRMWRCAAGCTQSAMRRCGAIRSASRPNPIRMRQDAFICTSVRMRRDAIVRFPIVSAATMNCACVRPSRGLASLRHGALAFNADSIGARLDMLSDVFARQLQEIGEQHVPPLAWTSEAAVHGKPIEPHGHILQAALAILQDGVARDAKTILDEALARKLVPSGTPTRSWDRSGTASCSSVRRAHATSPIPMPSKRVNIVTPIMRNTAH